MRRRDTIVGLGAALLVPGCASNSNNDQDEFVGIGQVGNTSEPPPGVHRPIAEGDLLAVQKRGAMLFNLHRALRLGHEQGARTVGTTEGDIVLPLVDVDPGGRSAQALFVRWSRDRVGADGSLHPKYAKRWLLVSLMLEPERVLDRELISGDVGEDTVEFHRIAAMLSAAKALQSRAPDTSFHLFTVAELARSKGRRNSSMIATRVYAMGVADDGPDYEVLVDEAKKSKIPDVLSVSEIHAPGAIEGNQIRVLTPQPAPASVARIMSRGVSGSAEVESASGLWLVDGRTGLVSRP